MWPLQERSYFKVAVVLKEGEKANFWSPLDSFENQVAAHVFVAVVSVCWALAYKHSVDQFLRRVAVFIDEGDAVHVHVVRKFLHSFREDSRVDE